MEVQSYGLDGWYTSLLGIFEQLRDDGGFQVLGEKTLKWFNVPMI